MKRSHGSRLAFFSPAPMLPCSHALLFILLLCSLALLFFVSPSVVHADWGPDVQLTQSGTGALCGNEVREIATDNIGYVHVVWYDWRDGNNEIYYKRSTDLGKTWGPDVRLTYDSSSSSSPALAVDNLGGVYIAWQDHRSSSNDDVFFKYSTDWGVTWSKDTLLSDTVSCSIFPAIAADDSGRLQLSWYNFRPIPEHIYYRRSLDRGVSWEGIRLLGDSLVASISLATLSGRRCFAVSGRLWFVRSTDGGSTWSPETCLTSRQPARGPCLTATEGGYLHLVWMDQLNGPYPYYDIYYKKSVDGGSTWGPDTRITFTDTLDEVAPVIEGDDSARVHLFYQRWGIYYQCSTDGGGSWGSPIFLIPRVQAWRPHLSVDKRRNAHLVWQEGGNIYYKRWEPPSGVETSFDKSISETVDPLRITPNPFTSFATLPGHEAERFNLYDVSGRKVGTYRGDRIGEGLSAGVYFLKPFGGNAKPIRIVKLR